ncbi:MAG: hypothetical protein WCD70_06795 [Alphaproteobacteria bacterium]
MIWLLHLSLVFQSSELQHVGLPPEEAALLVSVSPLSEHQRVVLRHEVVQPLVFQNAGLPSDAAVRLLSASPLLELQCVVFQREMFLFSELRNGVTQPLEFLAEGTVLLLLVPLPDAVALLFALSRYEEPRFLASLRGELPPDDTARLLSELLLVSQFAVFQHEALRLLEPQLSELLFSAFQPVELPADFDVPLI